MIAWEAILTPANLAFVAVMAVITAIDCKTFKIPNAIVLPAIVLGVYFTGNLFWAAGMMLIGLACFGFEWTCPRCQYCESHKGPLSLWRGGDVKLLSMIGAFFGIKALGVLAISYGILILFRRRSGITGSIAFSPFVAMGSVILLIF